MNVSQVVVEAVRSMNANRLRTGLTMLGIIIGITAVVMLLALGESMRRYIDKELEQLGTNMLYIAPGADRTQAKRSRSGAPAVLTVSDAGALEELQGLVGVAPAVQGGVTLAAGNESFAGSVRGITPAMFKIRNWRLRDGSFFTDADVKSAARMVVIGKRVSNQFFYQSDPIGKFLRIEKVAYQVVGVLEGEGKELDGGDIADLVLVPITAARANLIRESSADSVHYVIAQGGSGTSLKESIVEIKETLRDRHRIKHGEPDDFRIDNLASFADEAQGISAGVAALLGLIGAISLVVGGIGIMNIMLVSVTERTREIGIRMAIGAKPRDILYQFLVEAVLICVVGGLIGILLAFGIAAAVSSAGKFLVVVTLGDSLFACAFASLVGMFFGFYPARRASRLLPVECLRYE